MLREKEEREGNESESEEALFYKRDEEMTSPGGLGLLKNHGYPLSLPLFLGRIMKKVGGRRREEENSEEKKNEPLFMSWLDSPLVTGIQQRFKSVKKN